MGTSHARTVERAGWKLKLPANPPRLAETPVRHCRHPREHAALAVSLLTLAALVVGAVVLETREVGLALGGLWVSMIVVSLQASTYNRLRGAEVTPTQFPDVHRLVAELRQRFDAPPVQVFVVRNPVPEAHAYGVRAPYVIVLHSALLDSLDGDELRYAVGRQLAHIRFGHTRVAILLGGDQSTLPALLGWVASLRDLLFAWYRRTEVMSADRAGVLASASVATALQAQLKLSVGSAHLASLQPQDIVEQAFTASQGVSRLQGFLIRLRSTSPPLIPRLQAMVEWAGLPERQPHDEDGGRRGGTPS